MDWGLVRRRVTRRHAGLRTVATFLGVAEYGETTLNFNLPKPELKYFVIFWSLARGLGPSETLSNSASRRAQNYGRRSWVSQNMVKCRRILIYSNHNNLCQFKNAQYCMTNIL